MLGQSRSLGPWVFFVAGVVWLGLSAWVWSRFALMPHHAEAPVPHRQRRRRKLIKLWLPRLLGLLPFLGVAFALLGASAEVPQGMRSMMGPEQSGAQTLAQAASLSALAGLVFFGCLCAGRRLRFGRRGSRNLPGYAEKLPFSTVFFLLASLLVAATGFILYGTDPVGAGETFQPGPTILFAAAGLVCIGTLITWFGGKTRWPILSLILVFAFALAELRDAGLIPDNHDIRSIHGELPARTDIATAFRAFLASNAQRYPSPEPVPVVLVATSSGGLAASYWTATILGDLADSVKGFSNQLFAVSSVSGGSLGAMETLAMLSEAPLPSACGSVKRCTQLALGGDFLAPILGSLLYPDLLQRFLPYPVFPDRAAALEKAWEAQWRAVTGDNRLAGPFLKLWTNPQKPWPALILNGTSVLRGDRLLASNLQFSSADMDISIGAADLLRDENADLPASTAAGTSARFPLFGPVGVVRDQSTGKTADLVVDGGYFEDFGATTLLETLDVLLEVAHRDKTPVRFIVIQIIGAPEAQPEAPNSALLPRGVWGPLDTLLHTREARGTAATHALARRVAALGGVYAPLRLGFSPTGESAPLSWSLSALAQHVIDVQWTTAGSGDK